MNLEWTKHLKTEEEKENFEKILKNSVQVISRLQDILKDRLRNYEDKEISLSVYDSPSWAEKQAHINGARGEIRFLEKLLNFLD